MMVSIWGNTCQAARPVPDIINLMSALKTFGHEMVVREGKDAESSGMNVLRGKRASKRNEWGRLMNIAAQGR